MNKKAKIFVALLLTIGLVSLLVFLAWYFSNIFVYVIISLVISTILKPLTNYIANARVYNFRIPRALAILISFSVFVTVLGLLVVVFVPLISEQLRIFSGLNFEELAQKITRPLGLFEEILIEHNLTNEDKGFLIEGVREGFLSLIKGLRYGDIFTDVLSLTGSLFIGVIAVVFISFFLLYEQGMFKKFLIGIIPNRYFEVSIAAVYKIEKLLSNYLLGLVFQMFSIFTIAFIGLSIVGVKYSASIALFAAVINIIPYLGPILGALFGVLVTISTNILAAVPQDMTLLSLKVIVVFVIVQVTDNLFVQPIIFSKSVKAHPLEIFIIIFAGATIAGIPGMIAAIPVYTVVRVSVKEIYRGYKSYRIFKI